MHASAIITPATNVLLQRTTPTEYLWTLKRTFDTYTVVGIHLLYTYDEELRTHNLRISA